jgi:hypothetical protein
MESRRRTQVEIDDFLFAFCLMAQRNLKAVPLFTASASPPDEPNFSQLGQIRTREDRGCASSDHSFAGLIASPRLDQVAAPFQAGTGT